MKRHRNRFQEGSVVTEDTNHENAYGMMQIKLFVFIGARLQAMLFYPSLLAITEDFWVLI